MIGAWTGQSESDLVTAQPSGYNGSAYAVLELAFKAEKWTPVTAEQIRAAIDAEMGAK